MKAVKDIMYRYTLLALSVLLALSCTRYETPPSMAGDIPEEGNRGVKRRVLWINIDGAVGQIVKDNLPTHLESMLPHSKYTFEALADNRTLENTDAEDVTNWATLLTGMTPGAHMIRDNSYFPDMNVNPEQPNQTVAYYPNVIKLIVEASPSARTFCVTPHRSLNENMLSNAFRTVTSSSDEEARDLVVESIENEEMDFTLVSFKGMLEAGKNGGFTASNTAYKDALQTIDGYIGECLEAIKNREEAPNEDWLVVITSGHGGTASGSWGGTTRQERNALCIFYYEGYSSVEMKGEMMEATYFDSSNSATVVDTNEIYSAGEGRTLSVEVLMRLEPRPEGGYGGGNWDRIMGKRSWGIFRQRSNAVFRMDQGELGERAIEEGVDAFNNSLWHSYQVGIASPSPEMKEFVILYDGIVGRNGISPTTGYAEDPNDLVIGGTGVPTPYYIAEIRIWDKMLEEDTFRNVHSQLDVQPSHPEYKHLVGYWRLTGDELIDDLTFKNRIEGMPDLVFNNTPRIAEFANTLPAQRQSGNLIIENIMVAPQILYWLNAAPPVDMSGFAFLNSFTHEEEWREAE